MVQKYSNITVCVSETYRRDLLHICSKLATVTIYNCHCPVSLQLLHIYLTWRYAVPTCNFLCFSAVFKWCHHFKNPPDVAVVTLNLFSAQVERKCSFKSLHPHITKCRGICWFDVALIWHMLPMGSKNLPTAQIREAWMCRLFMQTSCLFFRRSCQTRSPPWSTASMTLMDVSCLSVNYWLISCCKQIIQVRENEVVYISWWYDADPCRVVISGEFPADLQKRVDRYRPAADGQVLPGQYEESWISFTVE